MSSRSTHFVVLRVFRSTVSVGSMSTLAPGILIAAPPMGDANFDRSVVLLASHDEEGAFGWVINGTPMMTVAELLEQAELNLPSEGRVVTDAECLRAQVSRGGPVSQEQVWLVYPAEERLPGVEGQLEIAPGIYATASRAFLERLVEGFEVPHLRAFAGYAGWGPGQLEAEIQQGGWLPGDIDYSLVFESKRSDTWQLAFELQGVSPISFTSRTVGSA